ncbi:hypothetical protein Dsin_004819 [Dipteronia sinensis]|uniref:BED-type domain-containing protein n=1 Tax=Dipteronia sinensis TaxID=43782 RepID=A0AAE0AVQ5_9ROSI|nr:hypothetical protein Dsin_004819 [Dipteronia sinensis]
MFVLGLGSPADKIGLPASGTLPDTNQVSSGLSSENQNLHQQHAGKLVAITQIDLVLCRSSRINLLSRTRKMNDDNVLPTNVVDSSSSKGEEAVQSGSLERAPLKGNVKPIGGKGRQTSDSWNHFTKYQEDGRMRAQCKYCPKNYACDSNTNGTTNMNKHLEKCKNYHAKLAIADPKQKCITSYTTSSKEGCGSSIGLGIFNKEDTRKALVEMLIVDELPFRFVEKRGFRKFCRVGMPRFDWAAATLPICRLGTRPQPN